MLRTLFIAWLIILHLAVLAAIVLRTDIPYRIDRRLNLGLIKPQEMGNFYKSTLGSHVQMDGSVQSIATIFLGDSITQGLNVSAITHPAVNFGIGKDTSYGLLKRITKYQSLKRAKRVVITIGVNDIIRMRRTPDAIIKNYEAILDTLPPRLDVLISLVLPANDKAYVAAFKPVNEGVLSKNIEALNVALRKLAKNRGVTLVDAGPALRDENGQLADRFHIGDGLHLSTAGYAAWAAALRLALGSAAPSS